MKPPKPVVPPTLANQISRLRSKLCRTQQFAALAFLLLLLTLTSSTHASLTGKSRTIAISGSSTLVPLLRDASDSLSLLEPGLNFTFQSPGSIIGQRQLISGSIQIACSDIPMDPAYTGRFAETKLAITPIAVIVHRHAGVNALSESELRTILDGRISNWRELGGADLPILVVMRSDFSGIRHEVNALLQQGQRLRDGILNSASNAEVVQQVAQRPGAIGFVGGTNFAAATVMVLAVDGYLPTEENILSQHYRLRSVSRLLHTIDTSRDVEILLSYVTSGEFSARLRGAGFIPLHTAPSASHGADAGHWQPTQPRPAVNPWEILGLTLAGTGVFLMGMRFISASLKRLANRKLRTLLGRWTRNPVLGAIWGILCGAVSQSGTSSGFLLAGFVASGMLPLRNAMFILAWSDVGTTFLVFLAAVNLKLPILYFLAFVTIAFSFDRRKHYDAVLTAGIGLALLLFGFDMVKSTAGQLTELLWVQSLMSATAGNLLLLLLFGAALRILTQSSSVVTLLSIPLVSVGILCFSQSMVMICGTCLGSAAAAVLLSGGLKGQTRQLLLFKATTDVITAVLLFGLVIISDTTAEPLLLSVLGQLAGTVEGRIALFFLATKLLPTVIALLLGNQLRRLVARLSPVTVEEELSRPIFIHDQALENPESAITLVQLESQRILHRLPMYLDNVRDAQPPTTSWPATSATCACGSATVPAEAIAISGSRLPEVNALHAATLELGQEINATISELFAIDVGYEHSELLVKTVNQHHTLMDLAETLSQVVVNLEAARQAQSLQSICVSMGESLHSMLQFAAETANSNDAEDLLLLLMMSSDKGSVMQALRNNYLRETSLPAESRPTLLHLTNLFQRAVWHLHRWAST